MTRIAAQNRRPTPSIPRPAWSPAEARAHKARSEKANRSSDSFDAGRRPNYASLSGTGSTAPTTATGSTQTREQKIAAYVEKNTAYETFGKGSAPEITAEQRAAMVEGLMRLPAHVVDQAMKDKMKFRIFLEMPPGDEKTGAGYCWSNPPILIINHNVFDSKNAPVLGTVQNGIVHEMGHYYDDVLKADTKKDKQKDSYTSASSTSPELKKLFEAYQARFRETLASFASTSNGTGAMNQQLTAAQNKGVLDVLVNLQPERAHWDGLTADQQAKLASVVFDGGYSSSNFGEFVGMATEKFWGTAADRAELKRIVPELYTWLEKNFGPKL